MASSESDMRSHMCRLLKTWHAVPIESGLAAGVPDVNYIDGWIECKSVDLPKKPTTVIRVKHFSQDQKFWLTERWQRGGASSVMLKTGPWWLLFDAPVAVEIVGKVTILQLTDRCVEGWARMPKKDELMDGLRKVHLLVKGG